MTAEIKIGFVNFEAVFQAAPQFVEGRQKLAAEFKDQQDEIKRLQDDIEYQLNKREREAATMSEQQIKDLESKIIEMRNEYAAKAAPLKQAIEKRMSDENRALSELITNSVNAIAAAEDFDVILSAQSAVYAKEEFNLSEKVLAHVSAAKPETK